MKPTTRVIVTPVKCRHRNAEELAGLAKWCADCGALKRYQKWKRCRAALILRDAMGWKP